MAVPDTTNPAIRAALQGYATIGEQVKARIPAFADYPVEVRIIIIIIVRFFCYL